MRVKCLQMGNQGDVRKDVIKLILLFFFFWYVTVVYCRRKCSAAVKPQNDRNDVESNNQCKSSLVL